MEVARLDLKHALDADTPNRSQIMGLAEKVGEAHIAIKKHRLNVMLDIREMLTPEQVKTLKSMRHERQLRRSVEIEPSIKIFLDELESVEYESTEVRAA